MNKLLLTDEELNYLELLLHNHEYEESERHLIDSLEVKFYKLKSDDYPLEITPFQEELEVKKYIRDNPITPEKVTQTQLQSIKGNLL